MNITLIDFKTQWYYIVLIVIGALLVLSGLVFLTIYLISLNKKNKVLKEAKNYYNVIIDAVGGIDNIIQVGYVSSRMNFMLKDFSLFKDNVLVDVGVIKSSKKITLVVGSMAGEYCEKIQKILKDK